MLFLLVFYIIFNHLIIAKAISVCGYPGSPSHAKLTFMGVNSTLVKYTCDSGYDLLGPSIRTCISNGTWIPQMIPICALNVGVGKATMQSSTVGQAGPQKAVDGSTSKSYNSTTCTMTKGERSPWWYVNLLEPYLIRLVRIDFGISCCADQPAVLTISIGGNNNNAKYQLCNRYIGQISEGKPLFFLCDQPLKGKIVSIHLESNGNPLSICEAFIYTEQALSIEQCPSFRDQPLATASTFNGKCYTFYHKMALNFENAKKFCSIRKGSLITEVTAPIQAFISWELHKHFVKGNIRNKYWLGAVYNDDNDANIVGEKDRLSNDWKWINGKQITKFFWSQNFNNSKGNCSRFDSNEKWLWMPANCKSFLNIICQYNPITCGEPERSANTTILSKQTSYFIGSSINYSCESGNILIGNSSRTCLSSGFYSNKSPTCKYIRCEIPASIKYGSYKLLNNSRDYMSIVRYSCKNGYSLIGNENLICSINGKWKGSIPSCQPTMCNQAASIENGIVSVSSDKAIYECNDGYKLSGSHILICENGQWNGQLPECISMKATVETTVATIEIKTIENNADNFKIDIANPVAGILFHSVTKYSLVVSMIIILCAACILWIFSITFFKRYDIKPLDNQTVTTDLESEENTGFYRNYKESWDNLGEHVNNGYVYVDESTLENSSRNP